MDSEFIKSVMISLVMAVVLVIIVNVIGELVVRPRAELPPPQKEENSQETGTPQKAVPAAVETDAPVSIASLLAAYDPKAGKKAFRKCKACHTSMKGYRNGVGPNLWEVVGRKKGSIEGFKYSDAMKLKGGTWTYKDLDRLLTNPRTFIMGTKMSIKGYKDPAQRATLIGFLRSLSDNPKTLTE